jgi:hypothetical protein
MLHAPASINHSLSEGYLWICLPCARMQGISNLVDALSTQLTSMLLQDLPDMIKKVGHIQGFCNPHITLPLPSHLPAHGSGTQHHYRRRALLHCIVVDFQPGQVIMTVS